MARVRAIAAAGSAETRAILCRWEDGWDREAIVRGFWGCRVFRWYFLLTHIEGTAAYCDHPVRFGVVDSLNATIKTVLRKGPWLREEVTLLLKLKWATAHPTRSARDLARFLNLQPSYSNR